MSQDIIDFFLEEKTLVKEKKCPFCGKKINEDDFVDELSKREYEISGLCQSCQDETFGGKQLKKNKRKEMTKEDAVKLLDIDLSLVVDESSFGDFSETRIDNSVLWERHPAKTPSHVYFLPSVDDPFVKSSNVLCQVNFMTNKKSEGYAGRTWTFKCTDGNTYEVQGPWHSNTDSLFSETGIDLRDKHRFHIIICEKSVHDIISHDGKLSYFKNKNGMEHDPEYELRSRAARCIWGESSYRFQGYNLLHRFTWNGNWDNREYIVAQKVIQYGKDVYCTIQSSGGSSTKLMTLENAKDIIKNHVDENNKSYGL